MRACQKFLVVWLLAMVWPCIGWAQTTDIPDQKKVEDGLEGWLGVYSKYRIGEKTYYSGEYHYRRKNYLEDMGQVYLRFGLTYLINNHLEVTGGIVTPLYWAPNPEDPNIDNVVPQFRFWEQLLFVQSFERAKVYHQLRLEQRWRRDYLEGSPFELTWRYRYKIMTYVPMNETKLVNRTLFLVVYDEIFIQSGKSIIYDHFEDNRLNVGLGYIVNENYQVQMSHVWSWRHKDSPYAYESRSILRVSLYHNLDFYSRRKDRSQKVNRILRNEF